MKRERGKEDSISIVQGRERNGRNVEKYVGDRTRVRRPFRVLILKIEQEIIKN